MKRLLSSPLGRIETRRLFTAVLMAAMAAAIVSCKKGEAGGKAEEGARQVNIAHTVSYVPYDYLDEKGNSCGFEVALMKAVDELLPQYTFRFCGVAEEELLIGVETGKYQAGIKGVWMTEERRKKYIFPKEPSGVSVIGIAYRAINKDEIHDIDSFAKYSGKLVPISPQSAQYAVVTDYNKAHPTTPITLLPSDVFDIADAYTWVLEGRYDAFFDLQLLYQHNVLDEGGAYHDMADKLLYAPYKGIPTWPLFNRGEQELSDAYDTAVRTIKDNGTFAALSQEYFGEDLSVYLAKEQGE